MADDHDLRDALDGRKDLVRFDLSDANLSGRSFVGCDFSSANLFNTDFSNCNLEYCRFDGTLHKTNFLGASLKKATFNSAIVGVIFVESNLQFASFTRCHFTECYFGDADISSADFSEAVLEQGNLFDGVRFNSETNFDRAKGMRSYSKLPILANYTYAQGVFSRKTVTKVDGSYAALSIDDATSTQATGSHSVPANTVKEYIESHTSEVVAKATSLYVLIDEYLKNRNDIPNDPVQLDLYLRTQELLQAIANGLAEIASSLAAAHGHPSPEAVSQAAFTAETLGTRIIEYLKQDPSHIVAGVRSSALIGLSSYFLMSCGCSPIPATLFSIAQFGAEGVFTKFRDLLKSGKGDAS